MKKDENLIKFKKRIERIIKIYSDGHNKEEVKNYIIFLLKQMGISIEL